MTILISLNKVEQRLQATFRINSLNHQTKRRLTCPEVKKNKLFHPKAQIIGDTSEGIKTRSSFKVLVNPLALIYEVEPKTIDDAITKKTWIEVMQEKLHQFEVNKV